MPVEKIIPPEIWAEARRLYEQTLAPVADIYAMAGLSRSNFYKRVREEGWRGRRARTAPFHFVRALSGGAVAAMLPEPAEQPRAEPVANDDPVTPAQRVAMALRIQRVAEQEFEAAERILKAINPADPAQAELGARTLASVSRALREIDALNRPPQDETPHDAADDDAIPRDIDAFRFELARRINALIDARRARMGGGDGGSIEHIESRRI